MVGSWRRDTPLPVTDVYKRQVVPQGGDSGADVRIEPPIQGLGSGIRREGIVPDRPGQSQPGKPLHLGLHLAVAIGIVSRQNLLQSDGSQGVVTSFLPGGELPIQRAVVVGAQRSLEGLGAGDAQFPTAQGVLGFPQGKAGFPIAPLVYSRCV